MGQPHPTRANAQEIIQSLCDHQRLIALVRTMAEEIERLDNDNMQLRAAVSMYREALLRKKEAQQAAG